MADRMSKERRAEIRDNCERGGGGGYPGRLIPADDALDLLDEVERLEAEVSEVRQQLGHKIRMLNKVRREGDTAKMERDAARVELARLRD